MRNIVTYQYVTYFLIAYWREFGRPICEDYCADQIGVVLMIEPVNRGDFFALLNSAELRLGKGSGNDHEEDKDVARSLVGE
jgi:hypothetical protein